MSARDDYGVVVTGSADDGDLAADQAATTALRARLRQREEDKPFFDRGPGYATLSPGAATAAVDWL
jgi:N-methylhydantoinase B